MPDGTCQCILSLPPLAVEHMQRDSFFFVVVSWLLFFLRSKIGRTFSTWFSTAVSSLIHKGRMDAGFHSKQTAFHLIPLL